MQNPAWRGFVMVPEFREFCSAGGGQKQFVIYLMAPVLVQQPIARAAYLLHFVQRALVGIFYIARALPALLFLT